MASTALSHSLSHGGAEVESAVVDELACRRCGNPFQFPQLLVVELNRNNRIFPEPLRDGGGSGAAAPVDRTSERTLKVVNAFRWSVF